MAQAVAVITTTFRKLDCLGREWWKIKIMLLPEIKLWSFTL